MVGIWVAPADIYCRQLRSLSLFATTEDAISTSPTLFRDFRSWRNYQVCLSNWLIATRAAIYTIIAKPKYGNTLQFIIREIDRLTMKTIGVAVLFIPIVYATKGFTYNDDIVCGYPFENFIIETISCAPPTYVHAWPEGGEATNLYDSHDVCAFGNEMEIAGKVTVSQAVARIYHANLNACFRTSAISWYSAKKCMLFKTTLDLRTYSKAEEEQVENGEGEAVASSSQTYVDYVEPGEFAFSARVLIPKKTFVFNSGTMTLAKACSSYSLPILTDMWLYTSDSCL